ncbi:MAG: ATP-dependent DNA helicase [Methylococcales bacterium]|nr:ATP-dependent DNA helicase [Methylococcales bacterium]
MSQAIEDFFAEKGPLAKVLPGYQPRPPQRAMAQAISAAIDDNRCFIAEAGTGTGKTLAYLSAALASGKKTLIATGTRNLQDQLFQSDLPLLRKTWPRGFSAALLKGRANYLCLYRLESALQLDFQDNKTLAKLTALDLWAKRTATGDIADYQRLPETSPLWQQVTSTRDNCAGQDCPLYDDCFLYRARRQAQSSDLVVINHHLLCADWSIRETGFGELLPEAEVIIIDEAHQLAETAGNFLGLSISTRALADLAKDCIAWYGAEAADVPELNSAASHLDKAVRDLRLAFAEHEGKAEWQVIEQQPPLSAALTDLADCLRDLTGVLDSCKVKSQNLEGGYKRAENLQDKLTALLNANDSKTDIRWYETHPKHVTLSLSPLDIAGPFQKFMKRFQATWIFTSATLSVAGKFQHFSRELGLFEPDSQSWDSPFDYSQQALFYHPKGLPDPAVPDFTERVIEFVVPVLEASGGRAFFLFTSFRALNIAHTLLAERVDYPLLVQGARPKAQLIKEFKRLGNAVLLGTASFWEGVDVRGDALSCVIIDKLPFAAPGDPVLKARLEAMRQQGRSPFIDYQVPNAVIALRQGIGRLLRDATDRGVLMVCDPRLLKKSYGHFFLNSVPAMRRTRELKDVNAFFIDDHS